MSLPDRIRQIHRWAAAVFVVAVIANFAVIGRDIAQLVGQLTLVPLFPLLLTGVYQFFRPYVGRERGERQRKGGAA